MWIDYEISIKSIGSYSGRIEVSEDTTDEEIKRQLKKEIESDIEIDIYR